MIIQDDCRADRISPENGGKFDDDPVMYRLAHNVEARLRKTPARGAVIKSHFVGENGQEENMKAELAQDKDDPNTYRVEAIDDDGGCEVAVFSGPNALERAISFAGGSYYEGWADPQGLAGY